MPGRMSSDREGAVSVTADWALATPAVPTDAPEIGTLKKLHHVDASEYCFNLVQLVPGVSESLTTLYPALPIARLMRFIIASCSRF